MFESSSSGIGSGRTGPRVHPKPGSSDAAVRIWRLAEFLEGAGAQAALGPKRLACDLLVIVSGGRAVPEVDCDSADLAAGDVLWVRAGQVLRWVSIDALEGEVVLFSPHLVAPGTGRVIGGSTGQVLWHCGDVTAAEIAVGVQLLWYLAADISLSRAARTTALAHTLCALLVTVTTGSAAAPPPAGSPSRRTYAAFLTELDARFESLHSVQDYAGLLGYSVKTLDRIVRLHSGRTAKALIDERIILEAKRLLVHSDLSISSIGRRLGHSEPGNFSRFFTRAVSVSPTEFRSGHRITDAA
ncbi:helix-turn-helix domain-containing protein [Nocardia sp. JMUB6875]|uniref:helix-turn-helix domain-containing protein n=1 Tax=Nocardia sp. JMUB6875 TaxID=3158170 RepID=UPI0032E600C1